MGKIMMSYFIFGIAIGLTLFSNPTIASTKQLECKQTTNTGVDQIIYIKIDDDSDKAEVELFALSAECAKNRSCGIDVYNKDVLPSVIRLTQILSLPDTHGGTFYKHMIEIDRSTLSVIYRSSFESFVGNTETIAHGQCEVQIDKPKKKVI